MADDAYRGGTTTCCSSSCSHVSTVWRPRHRAAGVRARGLLDEGQFLGRRAYGEAARTGNKGQNRCQHANETVLWPFERRIQTSVLGMESAPLAYAVWRSLKSQPLKWKSEDATTLHHRWQSRCTHVNYSCESVARWFSVAVNQHLLDSIARFKQNANSLDKVYIDLTRRDR